MTLHRKPTFGVTFELLSRKPHQTFLSRFLLCVIEFLAFGANPRGRDFHKRREKITLVASMAALHEKEDGDSTIRAQAPPTLAAKPPTEVPLPEVDFESFRGNSLRRFWGRYWPQWSSKADLRLAPSLSTPRSPHLLFPCFPEKQRTKEETNAHVKCSCRCERDEC